jgi:hypothetical protein
MAGMELHNYLKATPVEKSKKENEQKKMEGKKDYK